MKPIFTVVITVFNKAPFIEGTLNCVLNQSFKAFEVLIVNDGSTDESLQIINGFNDERISIVTQENKGVSAARNYGISNATTEYIALLDGDDLWEPNYLETMHSAILKYPAESIFTTAIALRYTNKIVPVVYNFNPNETYSILTYFKHSLKHSIVWSSSVVFKKNIIETTGLFDTSLSTGEDTDLWIRFGLHYPIVFINKILAYHVHHDNSLSNTTLDLNAKPKFDNYHQEELDNQDLKKFLDKNRFALAILSKLYSDKKLFDFHRNNLSLSNLTLKQRLLIHCPKWLLKLILKLKSLKGEKLYYKPL